MSAHRDRYIPADTNGGWPIAMGIIALAVVCIVTVAYIHNKTYHPPTDVTWAGYGAGRTAGSGH